MQENIKQLLSLQERDLELDQIKADLLSIPREIAAIRKQIEDARVALEESKKELNQLQLQRKGKEVDLETKEGEIRKHSTELNSLKSNDSYRAMLGEIEKVKQEKSALEDQILQFMDKIDLAQKTWKERESATKASESDRQRQITDLETKQKNLEAQLAQKQTEREAATAAVPKKLMDRYQQLRGGKQGAVVVPIKAEQCSGCHMKVSPNLINEVKRGQNLMFCESCSRIVYLEEVAVK